MFIVHLPAPPGEQSPGCKVRARVGGLQRLPTPKDRPESAVCRVF